MGQAQSTQIRQNTTTEQLSHELALKFAWHCFSPIELYAFRDVFESLADHQDNIIHLKEDTIVRFLSIPDVLGVSSIIFHMVSYLGAFPFVKDAPAILGFEQMIMVLVVMTERYQRVLEKRNQDRTKLLFRSLAVYERGILRNEGAKVSEGAGVTTEELENSPTSRSHAAGFVVDKAGNDDGVDNDDDLAFAALQSLVVIDVFKYRDAPTSQSSIPTGNLKKLIMLLLLAAPVGPRDSLALHAMRLYGQYLEGLRRTANHVLALFVDQENLPSVEFHQFKTVISVSLPFLFNGFNSLFEHFLSSPNIGGTKGEDAVEAFHLDPTAEQLILSQIGEIMDLNVLSQISFFIPRESLSRGIRLLYSSGDAGFSMAIFQARVFNWGAPAILLVSGSQVENSPLRGQKRTFLDTLPPRKFPNSNTPSRVVLGVYLKQPWKQTYRECFGDSDMLLFQLEPVHEVFHASTDNTNYISFTK